MNKNIRILIVDDYHTIRSIVKSILNSLGYHNVHEAENGSKALDALNRRHYDFIITDWNMPGMKGIELLRAIRADKKLSDLPVLLLTAEATREQIVEAMHAGVDGYVVKPFTPCVMQQKIESIFANLEAAA